MTDTKISLLEMHGIELRIQKNKYYYNSVTDSGDKSRKENQARSKQLQKDIRGKFGRGPTKVKGSYLEKDKKTGEERKVKEKSYAIDRGKKSNRKFKKEVKKL